MYDFIIVGMGIVGSGIAKALARSGKHWKILVLERDLSEPNRIVGELLQPGGLECLRRLGMDDCVRGIDGVAINGYAVFKDGEGLELPYPEGLMGVAFHHGRFVQKLRHSASLENNVEIREGTVVSILEENGRVIGVEYVPKSKKKPAKGQKREKKKREKVLASYTILCDGCFSRFRKNVFQKEKPQGTSSFVGVILEHAELPFPNHGHVVLADPSPILSYPISSTEIRMLVDVPDPLPSNSNGDLLKHLKTITAPQLPELLQKPFLTAIENGRLRTMPNSRLHPEIILKKGLFLLGDALNMRHPLTGGGMTVGLSDCLLLSELLIQHYDRENLEKVDANHMVTLTFMEKRKPLAATINILAQALYEVFADKNKVGLRESCFGYFKLGGSAVSVPMRLLAGLAPQPALLFTHFFAAALYGTSQRLLPWQLPSAARLLHHASAILTPLIIHEHLSPTQLPAKL